MGRADRIILESEDRSLAYVETTDKLLRMDYGFDTAYFLRDSITGLPTRDEKNHLTVALEDGKTYKFYADFLERAGFKVVDK